MTITLTAELEKQLREKATREGEDISTVAEALIASALAWEAQERAEAIEGIRRGELAAEAGQERPLADFIADQRTKYNLFLEQPGIPGN